MAPELTSAAVHVQARLRGRLGEEAGEVLAHYLIATERTTQDVQRFRNRVEPYLKRLLAFASSRLTQI